MDGSRAQNRYIIEVYPKDTHSEGKVVLVLYYFKVSNLEESFSSACVKFGLGRKDCIFAICAVVESEANQELAWPLCISALYSEDALRNGNFCYG